MKSALHLHNQQGFTLVELLVSIMIMVIGIFACLNLIWTAMNANTLANQLTTKTALAQQVMEDLLSRDKTTLAIPVTDEVYKLNGTADDLFFGGSGTYHATYTTALSATPSLVQISVKITVKNAKISVDGNPLQSTAYRYVE